MRRWPLLKQRHKGATETSGGIAFQAGGALGQGTRVGPACGTLLPVRHSAAAQSSGVFVQSLRIFTAGFTRFPSEFCLRLTV